MVAEVGPGDMDCLHGRERSPRIDQGRGELAQPGYPVVVTNPSGSTTFEQGTYSPEFPHPWATDAAWFPDLAGHQGRLGKKAVC